MECAEPQPPWTGDPLAEPQAIPDTEGVIAGADAALASEPDNVAV